MIEAKKTGRSVWDLAREFPKFTGGLLLLAVFGLWFWIQQGKIKQIGPIVFAPHSTVQPPATPHEQGDVSEKKKKQWIETVQSEFNNLLRFEHHELKHGLISPNATIQRISLTGTPIPYPLGVYLDLIQIKKSQIQSIQILDVELGTDSQIHSISLNQSEHE